MARPWQRHYDYGVPTTVRYPRIPVHELVNIPANSHAAKPAVVYMGTKLSYWDLRNEIVRFANALSGMGIKKGDRVGLHLPNCPQYIIAYYGALSIGAIVVNMNPLYTPSELLHIVDNTGLTTLVTADVSIEAVRALCQQIDIPRVIVTSVYDYAGGQRQEKPTNLDMEEGWLHFLDIIIGSTDTRRPKVDVTAADPALIQFTGGTTGIPKGAILTHGNIVSAAFQSSLWGDPITGRTAYARRSVFCALPFFHIYGNIVAMNWAMLNCATQVLVPRFNIDEVMMLISIFDNITFFPFVPTMLTAIVNHPKAEELELSRRFALFNSGGAPMPLDLIDRVKEMGFFYNEGWGMTESTSLGFATPVLGLKKAGSIGVPFPDTDVRVVDIEEGIEDVDIGEPGELIVKSPLVMQGYWNDDEKTADQIRDGWLYTGDIVVRDEDDYFHIVDRKKDMIIAGGYNIYPREIDEVLYQHPKIKAAVSVGVPHKYRGETVKAFVVLKDGQKATKAEIIAFCREKLAPYKSPKLVEFRDSLPQSSIGKVLRKVLREEEIAKQKQDRP
ncbi:MAG: long-chain fatty acid--CoA ligase [Candidatus Hydrogenedentes bacterium]|nr:long-chain fatty acid--CoA ligase [Candidatus Hydrogenedentota bacterium]